MTKENQKILYEHFVKLSTEHDDDLVRKNSKNRAAEILKSFPEFEKKAEPQDKPKPKEVKKPKKNSNKKQVK